MKSRVKEADADGDANEHADEHANEAVVKKHREKEPRESQHSCYRC